MRDGEWREERKSGWDEATRWGVRKGLGGEERERERENERRGKEKGEMKEEERERESGGTIYLSCHN